MLCGELVVSSLEPCHRTQTDVPEYDRNKPIKNHILHANHYRLLSGLCKEKSRGLPGLWLALRILCSRSRHTEQWAGMPQLRPTRQYDHQGKQGNSLQKCPIPDNYRYNGGFYAPMPNKPRPAGVC